MGLNIIRCNSRILSAVLRIKSPGKRDKLFTYSMKCNYVTDSQYFPCLPFEPSFTGHKFPKKNVINSFLHNIKMKCSLLREHTFWTEASLLAKTNGKPDCDLFVGIFQRVVLATCICSELLDWLF